jgi:hypothetical protein
MLRKVFVATSAALVLLLGAVPAHANVTIDPVIDARGVVGSCIAEHTGTGNTLNIVVEAAVEAPSAIGLTVRCHLTQGTRHEHVNAASALGTAAGGGAFTGFALAPYTLCTEVHANFATGGNYDKFCH